MEKRIAEIVKNSREKLVAALQQAEAEAQAAGLLPDVVDEARTAETTILGAG